MDRRTLWGFFLLLILAPHATLTMQVDPGCNFTLQTSPGEISSRNIPDGHPANKVCQWTIIMPRHEKISLTFSHLDVTPGSFNDVCDNDYVELIDDGSSQKICNNLLSPAPFLSSNNVLRVIFKSDPSRYRSRFLITYRKKPCGGRFGGTAGDIQSPNYPYPYPSKKRCTWQIDVPSSKVIKLTFNTFDLNKDSDCQLDFVKVRDGPNVTSREVGHYCYKEQPPQTIRSTGEKISVEFGSYSEGAGEGFEAYYEAVSHCGGLLSSNSGSFSSPGYPGAQPFEEVCTWRIKVSPGKIISLMFEFFDVRTGYSSDDSCTVDYVAVYDVLDSETILLKKICNQLSESLNIFSKGRELYVELHTSFANIGRGFFASYYAVSPDNHYKGCFEQAKEVLFTCDNGRIVHCKWKCDGTDECGDHSDENNCPSPTEKSEDGNQLRKYVTIILSVTGSALATLCIACMIDRIRKKHRLRSRRRRTRRLRCHRTSDTVPLTLAMDPSTPPPPYEDIGAPLHVSVSVISHASHVSTEDLELDASTSLVSVGSEDNVPMHTSTTNPSVSGSLSNVQAVLNTDSACLTLNSLQGQQESGHPVATQTQDVDDPVQSSCLPTPSSLPVLIPHHSHVSC